MAKLKKIMTARTKPPIAPMHDKPEFRILVCGSRDWTDVDVINKHLLKVIVEHGVRQSDVLVITGSAAEDDNGVDSLVEALCRNELGIACAIFRAPWAWARTNLGHQRAAGPIRNGWMLRWGQPNFVLAFHPYLPNSRGTKNMLKQAHDAGIPTRLVEK